jgi:pimeloyl-ACP methyl ester carboxylesterase
LNPYLALLRWLGPWAQPGARPTNIERREIIVDGARPFKTWVLAPADRRPTGALLVCPGLHYEGPADPRFVKFIEALAAAGILVHAPFLPDFLELRVERTVAGDLSRAFAALRADPVLPDRIKPGVFSISFGSLPSLLLAADNKDVGAVVVFGGYADFANAIRFAIGIGAPPEQKRDPLNQPVVLMNVIDDLPARPEDRPLLLEAWRRYVKQTWGRPELKVREKYQPIAERIRAELPESARPLFDRGVGLEDGALELVEAALEKQRERRAFLDPRPHLDRISCPIFLCHGMDDDVIPHTELELLRAAFPKNVEVKTYLTGLYHHTGASPISSIGAAFKEGTTLLGIMGALVRASRIPL